MATVAPKPIPVSQMNGTQDHKVNLFQFQPDGDWTRAIHHVLNIRRRTCTTFIPTNSEPNDPSKNANNIKCGCKRFRREHSWDVFEDNTSKWDQKQHTVSAYNNAYGRILPNNAYYIRCDIQTNPKILAQLMFEVWKVKEPQLIMCIIGGAKYFKLNERLEREFIKGIIQAALKADGWIVTSGYKTGVVQLVGEAIHDHKVTNPGSHITAIGCSKWGGVKNRESLILKKATTNINLDASMNRPKSEKEKGQQDLEPNHTHFLLLDDGIYYGYNIGDYRTRFVMEASRYQNKDVPIVTIVVEGGPDTLSTICIDLHAYIPVVLIDGSGRVPNLLAKFLARTEAMINRSAKIEDGVDWEQEIDNKDKNDIEKLNKKFHAYADEIRSGLSEIEKGDKKDKNPDGLFNDFLYCLQPAVRSRIRVYSLDSDHDLDDTIFEAIIQVKGQKNSDGNKGNKSSKEQLLKLALAWDAIEVAKEHIIKDDLSDLDKETKETLFFEALKRDRPDFINSFIKLNFNVSEMFYKRQMNKPWKLIWEKLADIYNNDYTTNKERRLLKTSMGKDEINSPDELDQVLRTLVGDYMKSIYTHSAHGAMGKCQVCCRCPQRGRVADSRARLYRDDDDSEAPDPEEAEKEVRELVYRDLFFWSILTNRIRMCKVIMSFMQSRTCAALIASKVMKSYQQLAHDNELKDKLLTRANEFEEYANQSLQCCYSAQEDIACEIAIRRIYLFGGVTCLQVAVDADDKIFVGQPCCDQLLNNIWYGKMVPSISSFGQWIGILLSICTFGLLAPFLISYRKEESSSNDFNFDQKQTFEMTVNQTQEENEDELKKKFLRSTTKKLHPYGVNYSDNYILRSNYCPPRLLNYFRRLKHFHEAPCIKFIYNAVSYIFFLLLFSYYLLFAFQPPMDQIPSINWTEILVIIIISTMLIEDIRQFLCQENRSILGKLSNYFIQNMLSSGLRVGSYILFYLGLILRFAYADDDDQLSAAKIVLAYDLELWFIRSLVFLGVARKMGPKLVMIRKMVIDLSFFVYVILVAMIGYGVASRSMYNFNNATDTNDDLTFDGRSIFRHLLYPIYYFMYGSIDGELSALDQNPDASTAIATQVLLAFYMLFVNILLVNLLIAMFSFTFQSVQDQTDLVWRYERYSLIREYFERPPLFPPFIIIMHFIECIKLILRHLPHSKLSNMNRRRAKTFKMIGANRQIDKDWSEFENYATNLYARTVVASQPSSSVVLTSSITNQESSQATADTMNMQQIPSNFDVKSFADEMSSIKRTIGDLRNSAEEMNRCMQWMMDAMERVKMSREPKPRLRSAITTNDIRSTVE